MLSLGTLRRRRRCVHAGSADTERIAGWLVSVFGLYSQCPLLPLCSMTVALVGGYQPGDAGADHASMVAALQGRRPHPLSYHPLTPPPSSR